jgi:hypothetical protein
MKLPNCENAIVDDAKLIAYCLDPEHKVGKHKARVFQSALRINLANFFILKEAILDAVLTENAIFTNKIAYGDLYNMDFDLTYLERTATVRTAWIVRNEEDFPRLTTCFIL